MDTLWWWMMEPQAYRRADRKLRLQILRGIAESKHYEPATIAGAHRFMAHRYAVWREGNWSPHGYFRAWTEKDRRRLQWARAILPPGPCAYCGGTATEIDHILPRSQGGLSYLWNLARACKRCNSAKGNRTPEQWRAGVCETSIQYLSNLRECVLLERRLVAEHATA